ncbi:MAG TPA: hypothetical protein VFH58_00235 [Acidimicrobiales bacterium]|nr:hypothetical protein [Acidimicrobiales bacterium]
MRRKAHGPAAGGGLRRTDDDAAVPQFVLTPGDDDHAVIQVEVVAAQSEKLSQSEAREGRQQHQGPVALGHGGRQGVHLFDRGRGSLGAGLRAGSPNGTRVLRQTALLDRRCEDGPQEPIGLGHGDRPDTGREEPGAPLADIGNPQLSDLVRSQHRVDVLSQQPVVELPGSWAEVQPLLEPGGREFFEEDAPGIRIEVLPLGAAEALGRLEVERLLLRGERPLVGPAVGTTEPDVVHPTLGRLSSIDAHASGPPQSEP